MGHDEMKKMQRQLRDMKMIMLKMDKRMKTMEKLLLQQIEPKTIETPPPQSKEVGFGTNMSMSDIHDDNVGFLNKKYKLYNSNVKNIYNDVFGEAIDVTQNDIINIVD